MDPGCSASCEPASVAAEMAMHYHAAHDLPRALPASVQAGQAAERVFAYREAMRHFERAIEIWPRVPDAAERAGIGLGEVLRLASSAANHAGEAGAPSRWPAAGWPTSTRRRARSRRPLQARPGQAPARRRRGGRVDWPPTSARWRCCRPARGSSGPGCSSAGDHMMLRGRFTDAAAQLAEPVAAERGPGARHRVARAPTRWASAARWTTSRPAWRCCARPGDCRRRAAGGLHARRRQPGRGARPGRAHRGGAGRGRGAISLAAERPEPSSYDAFVELQAVDKLIRLGRLDEAARPCPTAYRATPSARPASCAGCCAPSWPSSAATTRSAPSWTPGGGCRSARATRSGTSRSRR